ncbi:MAG: hypothetical protein ABSF78_16710 [Candidatus Acidiferrales bacterium]
MKKVKIVDDLMEGLTEAIKYRRGDSIAVVVDREGTPGSVAEANLVPSASKTSLSMSNARHNPAQVRARGLGKVFNFKNPRKH